MTNIVERLRAERPQFYESTMQEAANEIERLRKQCEGLAQAALNNGQDLLLKEAEIERLRAALQKIINEAESDDGLTAWDGSEIAKAALQYDKQAGS